MRRCKKCGQIKDESEFHSEKYRCKDCYNETYYNMLHENDNKRKCFILISDFKRVKAGNKFYVDTDHVTKNEFITVLGEKFLIKEIENCFNRFFKYLGLIEVKI